MYFSLLQSNYVIASRRPIISGSEKTWLYSCSCDDERQSFIAAQRKVHFAEDFTSGIKTIYISRYYYYYT